MGRGNHHPAAGRHRARATGQDRSQPRAAPLRRAGRRSPVLRRSPCGRRRHRSSGALRRSHRPPGANAPIQHRNGTSPAIPARCRRYAGTARLAFRWRHRPGPNKGSPRHVDAVGAGQHRRPHARAPHRSAEPGTHVCGWRVGRGVEDRRRRRELAADRRHPRKCRGERYGDESAGSADAVCRHR